MDIRKSMNTRSGTRERGATLVEFALISPVLILVFMGIIDLGRAIYYYGAISGAAREAARQSITACGNGATSVDCTTTDATTKTTVINEMAGVPITTSNLTISPSTRKYGDTITTSIVITFTPVTPLIARYLGASGNLSLSAESHMVVQ